MAITSAICNSFKTEILTAVHNFTATTGNTFNLALYTSSATFTANACLIYNDDQADKAVCAVAFGGDKSVSSGTFTIQFPGAAATTAIVRIA